MAELSAEDLKDEHSNMRVCVIATRVAITFFEQMARDQRDTLVAQKEDLATYEQQLADLGQAPPRRLPTKYKEEVRGFTADYIYEALKEAIEDLGSSPLL